LARPRARASFIFLFRDAPFSPLLP